MTFNNYKLQKIIDDYVAFQKTCPDTHLIFSEQQTTLKDAIYVAANAVDGNNKINSHQRRVGRKDLGNFADELLLHEKQLFSAKDFDAVLAIVSEVESEDIGQLTKYDTASRIAAYLGMFPDKIYLHCGTKEGAKNLFGNLRGRKYLLRSELPEVFQKSGLSESDFENLFCNFETELIDCTL